MQYLKTRLQPLSIEIKADYARSLFDLMQEGLLEGYCWQTTESAIVFLEEEDWIERGNLKIDSCQKYWHAWICFKFQNKIFVFDPCLQILVEKKIYHHVFEVTQVAGSVTAKAVREDLIHRINHPVEKSYNEITMFASRVLAQYTSDKQKKETHIIGEEDVNSPMYRNNTGYTATFESGKINSLIAHFYENY